MRRVERAEQARQDLSELESRTVVPETENSDVQNVEAVAKVRISDLNFAQNDVTRLVTQPENMDEKKE
jgi:hypothetical protein